MFMCGGCERPLVATRDRRCKLCNAQCERGIFTNVYVASSRQTAKRYDRADPGLGAWYLENRRSLRVEFKKMSDESLDRIYPAIWLSDDDPDPRVDDDHSERSEKLAEIRDAVKTKATGLVDGAIDRVYSRVSTVRYFFDEDAAKSAAFTWQELETLAKQYMIANGYPDARTTAPGADGGIDVDSSSAVGQVKHTRSPVGRPDVQRLYGVACSLNKVALFFSASGYSLDARAWAHQYGVELHEFDHRLAKFR